MYTESNFVNFRLLFNLLDKEIYSSLSDQESSYNVMSFIPWDCINQIFPSKELFLSTLSIYHQTIIVEKSENGNFKMRPLVLSCEVNENGVEIDHSTSALKAYLFHTTESTAENSYIEEVFKNAISKYNLRSDILYSIVSKSNHYKSSPENLKDKLNINYTNSMLKSRILIPIEETIHKLYLDGKLPFYFTIKTERAVIGRGSKMNNIIINTINYLELLRIKRLRPGYMASIMEEIIKLFPFDYPFIESDLNKFDDKCIERIYQMIKFIDSDPDYHKIATPTLVRFKLQQEYGIKIDMPDI